MFKANFIFKVFVLKFMFRGCHLITTESSNGAAELLWNLSARALYGEGIGRQYGSSGYAHQNSGFGLQNYPLQKPLDYSQNPYRPPLYNQNNQPQNYPFQQPLVYPQNPYRPPIYNQNNQPQNFMSVLNTIARNDDLQCVPKLLCELTSGSRTISGKQSSILPFELNMESLIGLLSSFSNSQSSSPLLHFGRAILLGYSTKGNSNSCSYSFPRCPSDPDTLVRYLNNYNGGFFRYFQGAPYSPGRIEQRIQTRPPQLMFLTSDHGGNRFRTDITFPSDNYSPSNNLGDTFYGYKSQKTLRFPSSEEYFRKPKLLSFPTSNAINTDFRFEKIHPNHIASPVIFPTRTGTGELIIDSDVFNFDVANNKPNHVIFA